MLLVSASVGPFKSINKPQAVAIDDKVTVLVGMNEAGKTIFLQALERSNDALGLAKFDPIEDFPRKDLSAYQKKQKHAPKPAVVTNLTYQLSEEEVAELNKSLHSRVELGFQFSVLHLYDNDTSLEYDVAEKPVLDWLLANSPLSSDAKIKIQEVASLSEIPAALKDVSTTDEDKAFLASVNARISRTTWESVVEHEAWEWLEPRIPKFLYFNDYDLLPDKMNLKDLAARVEAAKTDPKQLTASHLGVLALLRMADISLEDFSKPGGYEPLKAKIEAVSITLTDQIMEFWKQNEDLEVAVDINTDPSDVAPFKDGPNLYLRIENRRHRGVTTPFGQRSRGFIWFFSFLVWFDDVKHQIAAKGKVADRDLILLLDEPGLSLHALAQADFLRYIDNLTDRHQVLYTTHSPFMMHSERLHQIRVVEDRPKVGTVISDSVSGSDPRTIFPLQAALGWTIAQNLFISERNLLVEGPSELIYLKSVSAMLEAQGREGLREDITIVPTGGLDKVVTFVALLGANGLKLGVLHDYRGAPEQKLMDLVKGKMLSPKAVLNVSQFRDLAKIGESGAPTDIEDLFALPTYLAYFNQAYVKQLGATPVTEKALPSGSRVIERLERYIETKGIVLRPSGGFNHYVVASHFAINPPASLDPDTLSRFEALFRTVNSLF